MSLSCLNVITSCVRLFTILFSSISFSSQLMHCLHFRYEVACGLVVMNLSIFGTWNSFPFLMVSIGSPGIVCFDLLSLCISSMIVISSSSFLFLSLVLFLLMYGFVNSSNICCLDFSLLGNFIFLVLFVSSIFGGVFSLAGVLLRSLFDLL